MPIVRSGRIEPGTGQVTYSGEFSATGSSRSTDSSDPSGDTATILRLLGDVTGFGWPNVETTLSATGVSPGSYTVATIVVDAKGRITFAANGVAGGGGGGGTTTVTAGTGLTGGTITTAGTIALSNTGVAAGSYTVSTIVVDAQGRITFAANGVAGAGGMTSVTAGVGLTGGTITTAGTIALSDTGVAAGTYTISTIVVDAQGRITSADSGTVQGGGGEDIPVNFIIFIQGSPTNGQTIMRYQVKEPFTLTALTTDCVGLAEIFPTDEAVFGLLKNGVEVGTFTFGSGQDTGDYSSASDVTFEEDDIFTLIAPTVADATIANIGFTFKGIRINADVPQSFVVYIQGVPTSNQILFRYKVKEEFVIRASPQVGCVATCETVGTTGQTYIVRKNDIDDVGTFGFLSGESTAPLVNIGGDATFLDGDIFTLLAPVTVDEDMENIGFTFIGERI